MATVAHCGASDSGRLEMPWPPPAQPTLLDIVACLSEGHKSTAGRSGLVGGIHYRTCLRCGQKQRQEWYSGTDTGTRGYWSAWTDIGKPPCVADLQASQEG